LAQADKEAKATIFVEFMLQSLLKALTTDKVTDQVKRLLKALATAQTPLRGGKLMAVLGLSHRPTLRNNYLNTALDGGWVEYTRPSSSKSPTQKYRLTELGREKLMNLGYEF